MIRVIIFLLLFLIPTGTLNKYTSVVNKCYYTPTYLTKEQKLHIKLIATVIEAEASLCSHWEKKLVGATIMNRQRSPKFPNKIKNIINQKNQYYVINIKASDASIQAATEVVLGQNVNKRVLYFYNRRRASNTLFAKSKKNKVVFTTKHHCFTT